ncbi:MAG: tight adherence protein [Eubacteriales bacterium]|nr:tight adherence protein [Eubacteriales bacterium]
MIFSSTAAGRQVRGMLSLILIMVFLAVFLASWGILREMVARKYALSERIKKYTTAAPVAREQLKSGVKESNWKKFLSTAGRVFASGSYSRYIDRELARADIPLKGEEFIVINILAGLAPALLAVLLSGNLFTSLVFGIIGLLVPQIMLRRAKHRRLQTFNNQISDALVIMANSLRAGFSFLQAMEMVSKEMPPPISVEFGRALREMNLGTPTEEALLNMTKRIESDDLDLVVTAVLIQRQIGGNLSEVLDNISHTIRERIRIKGEIKTLTAQGRLSGLIVSLLPLVLSLVLYFINPSYIALLFRNPIGIFMVVTGVIMQVVGIFFIRRIVNIEV